MSQTLKETLSERIKRLMIFNAKGGVGKTAIALNFALTFGYGVITNDRLSIVDQTLESGQYMILKKNDSFPDIPLDWPVIFDFGGYPDKRALTALEQSQFVMVPILPHRENMQISLNFIKELTKYKEESKIIVIANQTTGGQYEEVREAVNHFYPKTAVFNLKKSAVFTWMTEQKKSIADLTEADKLHARHFKIVSEQFNRVAEHLLLSAD